LPEVDDGRPEARERSPAIYLVRGGRDCLVSDAHFLRDHEAPFKLEVIWDLVRDRGGRGRLGPPRPLYGGWSGHVRAWRRRTAQTEIARFEDLIDDPVETLRSAAQAIGVELWARGEAPTFGTMRAEASNPSLVLPHGGVVAGRVPRSDARGVWRRHGEQMRELGYPPD
jgi:hypothetical protein